MVNIEKTGIWQNMAAFNTALKENATFGSRYLHLDANCTEAGGSTRYWFDTTQAGDSAELDTEIAGYVDALPNTYEIEKDVAPGLHGKPFAAINYKTELCSEIAYTPEYIIHDTGVNSGLLDKTNYYRGYVDENNKGDLVLCVVEVYTIDTSDTTLYNSGHPTTSRTKTWQHVKQSDGQLDTVNVKVREKLYNTRRKRHKESIRRRENILEQLIDNVGLAGVLSAEFTGTPDAHEKLTELQKDHAAAIEAWKTGGRGSLYDDIANNITSLAWLDQTVADNASTQALCSWMIGLTFKNYMVDKIKGDIK
jgi:hypothetical protein